MKVVKTVNITSFTLELSGPEAKWLMTAMQNPLQGEDLDTEHEAEQQFRENLFHCLKNSFDSINPVK